MLCRLESFGGWFAPLSDLDQELVGGEELKPKNADELDKPSPVPAISRSDDFDWIAPGERLFSQAPGPTSTKFMVSRA
jgi:hypothetical protein